MKIRRILATAVAAAVTTPVVFLSAAPAFADTKPAPASTQKTAPGDEDPDFDEYEKLVAAVTKAEAKIAALNAERDGYEKKIDADDVGEAVATELAQAKKALEAAKAAKTTADETLAKAEAALKKLLETPAEGETPPTEQQKADAEKAVADAKKAAEAADAAKAAAQVRFDAADEAYDDALVALFRQLTRIDKELKTAKEELAAAEKALEDFENGGLDDCKVDDAVKVALTGPKKVTVGTSAVFSLRITNTTDRVLDQVEAYADATPLLDGEGPEDENGYFKRYITVEWTGAGNPHWSPLTEDFDAVEVGAIAKGGHADVKLRLTLDAKTPVGPGVAFAVGAYENNDKTCGLGEEYAHANFDILAAKTDKPKPEPTPSETTATPTPAPTNGGNSNTTQQGGSSSTPVKGSLAATGANENLTQLGLAAAATVALGAGALVIARRRKAGTNA
ncbi:peptidase [Streptomyces sp. TX20-6-3]|uniref:peptidase n=1 Tax=Streptomyces sp. TX20-6-3 TaxID=3028705 RepID=UPI0029BA1346|nr:peptidase [Streptomyces sp. TX20-6-3]MDX2560036.1 peptidase [Streptomyces sp. TX20-6-3]